MLNKDFYGRSGFVWWTGVVENNDDPLKLGSVQVRIIGIHSENRSEVPTESLPWAQVIQSPNNSSSTAVPRPGDWVFGFFQDGEYAQIPVVVGVYPGIESVQSQTVYNDIVVKKGLNYKPRPSQVDRIIGEPTTPRIGRGVMEGTLTNTLNSKLAHACDVKEPIEFAIRWARVQNGQLIQGLIAVIKSITMSLGSDPTGLISTATNVLKKIQTYLRWIQSILQDIQDYAYVAIKYAKIARAILDFITTLPERLRVFLRQCLAKIVSGVMAIINALFSTDEFKSVGDFKELATEFNNTLTEINKTGKELAETFALPGQFISAIVNPSSSTDQAAAEKMLTGLIDSTAKNGEAINNQTQYNRNSTVIP